MYSLIYICNYKTKPCVTTAQVKTFSIPEAPVWYTIP